MPATTLFQITNRQEAVDRALKAYLLTWGVNPLVPRATDDAADVLLIPTLQIGPSTGHLHKCPDGNFRPDLWADSVVEIALTCYRVNNQPSALAGVYTLFAEQTARITAALDGGGPPAALNALLPYHSLGQLFSLGVKQGFNTATGDDQCTIQYKCILGVRPTAWPTDPAVYAAPGPSS